MQRMMEKGDGYADAEINRLTKMMSDSSVTAARKELFQARLNILDAFNASGSRKTEL